MSAQWPLGSVWIYTGPAEFYSGLATGDRVVIADVLGDDAVQITQTSEPAPRLTVHGPGRYLTPAAHDAKSITTAARIYADRVHRQAWRRIPLAIRRQLALDSVELCDTLLEAGVRVPNMELEVPA